MSDRSGPWLSRDTRAALGTALVVQIPTGLLAAIATDGGMLLGLWKQAAIVYWIGVCVIVVRRPNALTQLDLSLIRWAFLPLIGLAPALFAVIGRLLAS